MTAAKIKDCRRLKPVLVAQIEFLEWTGENQLRHTKFIALRDDKPAREVRRISEPVGHVGGWTRTGPIAALRSSVARLCRLGTLFDYRTFSGNR